MSLWTWLWIGWGVYFAVVEGAALYHSGKVSTFPDNRDTLSEHLWLWFGINISGAGVAPHASRWMKLRRVMLLAFLAWFSAHMLTGGRFV